MAAQVNFVAGPITQATHPFTHNCQFLSEDAGGMVTIAGFRNLLDAHIGTLSKAKRVSYTRNQAWLDAIRDSDSTPPAGYAGNKASWKNEIGATNPETSKWIVENGRVYKKSKNAREGGPMTPTEHLYNLMTAIHQTHGHKGRDNFFNLVKGHSGSIKKAFCHQFVQVCCAKAESWQAGGHVPHGWQAPVKHRKARNNGADDEEEEEIDNNAVVDNNNAGADIRYPPSPEIMPEDIYEPGPLNSNFEEINAQTAANWGFQPRYPSPPAPVQIDLQYGVPAYFGANRNVAAAQNPFGGQNAGANGQYLFGFQYHVPDQFAFVNPKFIADDVEDYIMNHPEVFSQVQEDAQMQMHMQGTQQMDFKDNNQFNVASQIPQTATYYPTPEPQQQIIPNNNKVAERHHCDIANNDMIIDQNNQIMYYNNMVVDGFGVPQIPPRLGNAFPIQKARNDPNAPSNLMSPADMGADDFSDVDMDFYLDDSQMS